MAEDKRPEPAPAGAAEDALKAALIAEMKKVFGEDQKRIDHALQVLDYAERILAGQIRLGEPADPLVVKAAAILHDIGIQEAERKHGSPAAEFQELEGPPIARRILESLPIDAGRADADRPDAARLDAERIDPGRIDHICRIIGSHHTAGDIDTPEFRIIWDADRLGNAAHECPSHQPAKVQAYIATMFRTPAGRALAKSLLLNKS